jgi:hypothetical protein
LPDEATALIIKGSTPDGMGARVLTQDPIAEEREAPPSKSAESFTTAAMPPAPVEGKVETAESPQLVAASSPTGASSVSGRVPGTAQSAPASKPPTAPGFLSDRFVLAGVVVFIVINGVAKGVLTLMETIAAPLFADVYHDTGNLSADTGKWFTVLGLFGLIVYALMAVKRPRWAPNDLSLCVFSMAVCALGGLILAHPGGAALNKASLNSGAALIWSVGAPISDVVAVRASSDVWSYIMEPADGQGFCVWLLLGQRTCLLVCAGFVLFACHSRPSAGEVDGKHNNVSVYCEFVPREGLHEDA